MISIFWYTFILFVFVKKWMNPLSPDFSSQYEIQIQLIVFFLFYAWESKSCSYLLFFFYSIEDCDNANLTRRQVRINILHPDYRQTRPTPTSCVRDLQIDLDWLRVRLHSPFYLDILSGYQYPDILHREFTKFTTWNIRILIFK